MTSTADEPGRRRAVVDLVASERRLYPVGRLDADSTGLILLTNDGELANRLTHPRYGVAEDLPGAATRPDRRRARSSGSGPASTLDDGPTAPAEVRRVGAREIELTIREGRNRQVRRMLERVGNEVAALERIRLRPRCSSATWSPDEARRLLALGAEAALEGCRGMTGSGGKRTR